ncbi:MAG: hypothetical protein ABIB97_04475 [Patescibacteria group bacterium]
MKKIIFLCAVLLLITGAAWAASDNSQTNQEQNRVINNSSETTDWVVEQDVAVDTNQTVDSVQVENQVQNQEQGDNDGQNQEQVQTEEQNQINNEESVGEEVQERARDRDQLKTMIQAKKEEHQAEVEAMKEAKQQKVYQNQNQVRDAVHALLAAEDLVGGIGPQVSAIAREFDNSVEATIKAEEKIQSRSGFTKFFMGGDDQTADEILQQVEQNRNRVQELNQLNQEMCDCDAETKTIIGEQVYNMEQEQNRLSDLANQEKGKKGVFGWLFGWLVN